MVRPILEAHRLCSDMQRTIFMPDHSDPNDDFDPDLECFHPEPEELFEEPDEHDEYVDPDEWDKVMEERAADATPDDWWQDQLRSQDSERLNSIVEELVKKRCRRGELLLALKAITVGYWDPLPTRQQLLTHANSFLKLSDLFPPSIGDDFRLDDWNRMQALMLRCAHHLKARADSGKLNHKARRRELVVSLLALVHRETGRPNYRLLSELLLDLVGDNTLTPPTLRKMTSRRGVTKQRTLRPKLPRRPQRKRGRPARPSADKAAQRWTQAQIDAGNLSERRRDRM